MSEAEISDEQAQAAKDTFECAIRDYYAVLEPDVLVTGWVLVAHKVSDDMDRDGVSSVGTLVPTGQVWPLTRGLLDIGLEGERNMFR